MNVRPPLVVNWISRSGADGDCATTAIALATGVTYEAVLAAAVERFGVEAITKGMLWREIRPVVESFGFHTTLHRTYDLDEDTGILGLKQTRKDRGKGRKEHVVYLWKGRIVEPHMDNRSLWLDPDTYLKSENWTPTTLLSLDMKEGS